MFPLVVLVVFIAFMAARPVFADSPCPQGMSQLDCQSLIGNWANWVPDNGSSSCGDVNLIGGDNETKIWNFFKAQGLDDIHTAGIMGNLASETAHTWNPEIIQGGGTTADPSTINGGVGWGLAQWTPGSKALAVAKALGITTPIYDLATQLSMIWGQMQPSSAYPPSGNWSLADFKATTTVADAANYFNHNFEISADTSSARADNAQQELNKFQGGDSTTGGASTTCGGLVDCSSANGDAKILCAAQRYKGIWYEFGAAHSGRSAYVAGCPDPSNPPDNQATGKIGSDGTDGNPSPCAVDCSGLVSMAVDDAFDQKFDWVVADIVADGTDWKKISIDQAQPGDVLTSGTEHVAIFVSLNGNKLTTFEAQQTGTQVGQFTHSMPSEFDGAYHYIGPGSNE